METKTLLIIAIILFSTLILLLLHANYQANKKSEAYQILKEVRYENPKVHNAGVELFGNPFEYIFKLKDGRRVSIERVPLSLSNWNRDVSDGDKYTLHIDLEQIGDYRTDVYNRKRLYDYVRDVYHSQK